MSLSDELEIIRSSLLPSEELIYLSPDSSSWLSATDGDNANNALHDPSTPFLLEIKSNDSSYRIHLEILKRNYHSRENVKLQIKSSEMGREEALDWAKWIEERLDESWNEGVETGFPLYHILTTHLLPNLQDHSTSHPDPAPIDPTTTHSNPARITYTPAHILFTSHHLLAPSKRRNLSSLSSTLRLHGFGKVGYPGLIYAEGDLQDLEEFGREVKGWQWLNLRMRVLEEDTDAKSGCGAMGKVDKNQEERRRGEWTELGKVGEAVDYLRARGKERLLLDIGIGSGGSKT